MPAGGMLTNTCDMLSSSSENAIAMLVYADEQFKILSIDGDINVNKDGVVSQVGVNELFVSDSNAESVEVQVVTAASKSAFTFMGLKGGAAIAAALAAGATVIIAGVEITDDDDDDDASPAS